MNNKLIVLGLIFVGVASRLLPHEPNFTAVGAITLFSGIYLPKKYSFISLFLTMIISDIFLGFHSTIAWVYGSFILISLLSAHFKNKLKNQNIFLFSLVSSIIFFVITNFGVWVSGSMYSHNLKGLLECYTLALPFFRGTLMGDLFYTTLFFTGLKLILTHEGKCHTPLTGSTRAANSMDVIFVRFR